MQLEPVVGYFDGLCEWSNGKRNPGGLACGGWIVFPCPAFPRGLRGNDVYCDGDGATNNVAEYQAALSLLNEIYHHWTGDVIIRGDSKLVVCQFSGKWACNAPLLVPLLARLQRAKLAFKSLTLEWIPREQNEHADAESRIAYNQNINRYKK